jgi:hypothetical protein
MRQRKSGSAKKFVVWFSFYGPTCFPRQNSPPTVRDVGWSLERKDTKWCRKDDTATLHSACLVQVLQPFHWELRNHPPYSSDLAPLDYYLFWKLKQHLGGRQFHNNDKVEIGVSECPRILQPDSYHDGICKLLSRSNKCTIVLEYCVQT